MKKASIFFTLIAIITILYYPANSFSAVNLPWSTTFNCPDWTQSNGLNNINCDGLSGEGAWTCDNGNGTVSEEQITAAANYTGTGSGGGKGQRHWKGDGTNNVSGGSRIAFNSPQSELWVRFYMRYEQGFEWNPLNNDKILFIDVNMPYNVVFAYMWSDEVQFNVYGNPYSVGTGNGWNTIMANGATDARGNKRSDGQWHLYEIHIKMDTNGSNGIGEIWIDGIRRLSRSDIDFGSQTGKTGWSHIAIGTNNRYPTTNRCMFVDFDDISISGIAASPVVNSGGGSSSDTSISGGGCGFVKDINGKGQGTKGDKMSMVLPFLLLILLMLRKIKIRYGKLL